MPAFAVKASDYTYSAYKTGDSTSFTDYNSLGWHNVRTISLFKFDN